MKTTVFWVILGHCFENGPENKYSEMFKFLIHKVIALARSLHTEYSIYKIIDYKI